jgi:DNA invertase Pin-like site-specific DNA recombinase
MSKRVFGLIRVSTQGQAGDDRAGIPAQRESIARTAKAFDLQIAKTYELVDVSGALVLESPEMQELLRQIESPSIHGVVAKDFSRLFRPDKFTDMAVLQRFIDTKTDIYLPDGRMDLSSKMGVFTGTIRAAFAGLERREILDRMRDAKESMRRAGKHPGGKSSLPFGVEYSGEKGWRYTAEAEKVKKAFALFLPGDRSYAEIARELNIPRSNLVYVLENPIYTGWRVYDERCDPSGGGYVARPDGRQGYRNKIHRSPDEIIRVRVLEGIVSDQDFARAQQLIDLKRKKHWRGRTGLPERYTYSGFLTCGECGQRLYTHSSQHEYYICKTRQTRERRKRASLNLLPCSNKYMLRRKLEPKIDTLIGEKLQDSAFLAQVLRDYGELLVSASRDESRTVDGPAVLRKLEDLRAKKERVVDAFIDGVIDRVQRDEKVQHVDREIDLYSGLLTAALKSSEPSSVLSVEAMLQAIEPLADWEFLGRDDRRSLLRQLCPEISVYRYTVKSLTLNVGSDTQSGDTVSHPRTARSPFRAQPSR